MRARTWWSLGAAAFCGAALLTPTAGWAAPRVPDALTQSERRSLLAGATVTRPLRFSHAGGSYVGGVAYQVVSATPPEVVASLLTVELLPELLPRTKHARRVDTNGARARIELTQGNGWLDATYTIVLERAGIGGLRFRMDTSRPHDIDDVWGYFRARPLAADRTLLTVAVALDVGDPLVRWLFEDRIQRVILSAPRQIRDFLEPRALAVLPTGQRSE